MNVLLLELERLRAALRGIASCSTCSACRGAALRALELSVKAAVEGASTPVTPTPGTDCRSLPLERA